MKIQQKLKEIEQAENVTIIYACESGSRAWGFPSTNSDYDVRFLYIHRKDWYLSIDEGRDVIEKKIDDQLDISGWDIKKAFKLLRKSNPPLLEWLNSPIVYHESKNVVKQIRFLLPIYYSPKSCFYHYLNMANGNYRKYLKGEMVWLKKYLYVLRPLLACEWIKGNMGIVPMQFNTLVEEIVRNKELRLAIKELIKRKKQAEELATGKRIPVIGNFIEYELKSLKSNIQQITYSRADPEKLNVLFRSLL